MKSSVTSRKQRFWALLLAVVMVVGLLPTAGVKATVTSGPFEISRQKIDFEEDDYVNAGQTIKNLNTVSYGGSVNIVYLDVNEVPIYTQTIRIAGEPVSATAAEPKTTGVDLVLGYSDACEKGEYTTPCLNESISDRWQVYDKTLPATTGACSTVFLIAVPKIFFDIDYDGGVLPEGKAFQEYYIPGDPDVDLSTYIPEKESYLFTGWVIQLMDEGDPVPVNKITDENWEDLNWIEYENAVEQSWDKEKYFFRIEATFRPIYTINFYAKSNPNDEELTDVSGTMEPQIIGKNVDVTSTKLRPLGFSRLGYKFDGWEVHDDTYGYGSVGNEAIINELFVDSETGETYGYSGTNLNLYAQWTEDSTSTFTITFDSNYPGAETPTAQYPDTPDSIENAKVWEKNNNDFDEVYYEFPGDEELRSAKDDPKHYYFGGWRVVNPKEGVEPGHYLRESLLTLLQEAEVSDDNVIEMEAVWESMDYQFSFDANNPADIDIPDGIPTRIPKPQVEDDDPWALAYHEPLTTPDLTEYIEEGNPTVFLGWVFNPEHANNPSDDELIDKNTEYTVAELLAFSEAADAARIKEIYGDDDPVDDPGPSWIWKSDAQEYVLTGVWKKQYTIVFHPEPAPGEVLYDVFGEMKEQVVDSFDSESTELNEVGFYRPGYYFSKWYTYEFGNGEYYSVGDYRDEEDFRNLIFFDGQEIAYPENTIHLYAQWETDDRAKYKITFNNKIPEDEVYVNPNDTDPAVPNPAPITDMYWDDSEPAKIIMPAAPTNGVDPRHYSFLYWSLVKQKYIRPVVVDLDPSTGGFVGEPNGQSETNGNDEEPESAIVSFYADDQNEYSIGYIFEVAKEVNQSTVTLDDQKDGTLYTVEMQGNWEAKKYSFTFDGNYIEEIEPNQPYDEEGTVTIPNLDDQPGKEFVGWAFIAPDEEIAANDPRIIPGDAEMSIKELVLKLDAANDEWLADENNGTNAAVGREYQIPWRNNDNYQNSFNLTGIFKDVYTVTYHDADPEPVLGDVSEIYDTNRSTPVEIKSAEELEFLKEGVELVRWETRADGTVEPWYEESYQPGDSVLLEGNLDLYAVWAAAYTVTYDLNDHGSLPEGFANPQKVYDGDLAPEPDIADSEFGWTLTGWTCNNEPWLFTEDNKVRGNITLVAQWSPKTFTIEFVGNAPYLNSVNPESQTLEYDKNINIPNMPNGNGWKLVGWSYERNSKEADIKPTENGTWPVLKKVKEIVDNGTVDDDTVELYGVWGNTADVIMYFNYNGGEGELISYTNPEGSKDILPIEGEYNIKKTGYTLIGWDKNSEATEPTYKPGAEIALFEGTIYAIWSPMPYTVIYDYNAPFKEPVRPNPDGILEFYDADVTVPLYMDKNVDTAEYKFLGWSVKPGSATAEFKEGAPLFGEVVLAAIKANTISNDDVVTLYGVWEKQVYTVTFYDADGEEISSEEYVYGTEVKDIDIPDDLDYETIAIKYVFTGWDKEVVDVKADAEYTAQYEEIEKKYDFIFVSNEQGLDLTTDDDSTLGECRYYQYPIWLPELKDSTNKYKVYGWGFNTKDKAFEPDLQVFLSDVIDGAVAAGTIIEPDAEHENYRIKLYALWTDKPLHKVIWQDGEGNVLYKKENVPEGAENPDDFEGELPSIDDDQYAYDLEWEEYDDGTDDIVYRPKFVNPTVKTYMVTFVDEDGTTVLKAATEYEYGTIAADIAKPTPTKDGYDFAGWDPEVKTVTKDATYKAKYTAKQFGVKFIDYDNREINETQYTYGTKAADIVKPADPARDGYTFTGWTPAIADVTGNATYTATYVQNASGGNDNPVVKYWTITWKNYDGKGSETTTQVKEGDVPAYNGTPSKAEDNAYTYTFKGWTPAVVAATADATYTAEFTGSAKQNNNNNNVTTPTPTPTPEPTPEPTPTPTPSAPAEYDIEYYEEFPDGTAVLLKKTNNPDKYTYGVGAEIKYGIDKEGYKFNGWYSKRSKKYVTKIGTTTKGTVKLYARFVPVDDGNGEGGDNGSGTPASDFGTLFVRLTEYTEDSMKLVWELMDGVDGYDIFGSRCNSADVIRPYEPIASVEGDISEYEMENLLAKTYYKFYVRAYILVNGEKRYITTSINVHGVTLNDKYGVADDINIEKVVVKYTNGKSKTKYNRADDGDVEELNITMKVGQTLKVVASEYNADGKEIRAHRPISFESSNTNICKIGTRAKHKYGIEVKDKANTYKSYSITAKAEGECTIYVFAQNGIYTKVNVTVKAAN